MRESRFTEIKGLNEELLSLGYHQYQIDALVREVVHTIQLEKVSSEELTDLVKALEQHRNFARKCREN